MAHLCSTQAVFDLSRTMAAPLLAGTTFPWEALAGLEKFIFQLGEKPFFEQYERMGDYVGGQNGAHCQKRLSGRAVHHRPGHRGAPRGFHSRRGACGRGLWLAIR